MEEKNNFDKLLESYEDEMPQNNRDAIHSGVWGTLGMFKFVGAMIDMYVPKLFQFLIELSQPQASGQASSDDENNDKTKK